MPKLSVSQINNANLVVIEEVRVQEGHPQNGEPFVVWSLLIGAQIAAIKLSRVKDTQLEIVVEKADQETLKLIKDKLIENSSLREQKDHIASANWVDLTTVARQIN
ncbi:hypothetical protein [Pseudomonas sp. NPDC087614]|uniref:hypothetical protein n=1 Tax=Pseudomonas sp. NPDC087614 TaxID=3364442 RepID=UPI0037FDB7C9